MCGCCARFATRGCLVLGGETRLEWGRCGLRQAGRAGEEGSGSAFSSAPANRKARNKRACRNRHSSRCVRDLPGGAVRQTGRKSRSMAGQWRARVGGGQAVVIRGLARKQIELLPAHQPCRARLRRTLGGTRMVETGERTRPGVPAEQSEARSGAKQVARSTAAGSGGGGTLWFSSAVLVAARRLMRARRLLGSSANGRAWRSGFDTASVGCLGTIFSSSSPRRLVSSRSGLTTHRPNQPPSVQRGEDGPHGHGQPADAETRRAAGVPTDRPHAFDQVWRHVHGQTDTGNMAVTDGQRATEREKGGERGRETDQ